MGNCTWFILTLMKVLENIYVKIFVYIIVIAGMVELSRLAFWLMNQSSSYAVYAGFIIALALALAAFKICLKVSEKAVKFFTKPEQENDESN